MTSMFEANVFVERGERVRFVGQFGFELGREKLKNY